MPMSEMGVSPDRERGGADNDAPYEFGHPPHATWTYPFDIHQFARLLVLRAGIDPVTLRCRGADQDPPPRID